MKSRCKTRTKAGKPCGAAATAGGLCFFHANPNKAAELGRIGGRSNRHAAAGSGDPLPTLDNAVALRDTGARLVADVIAGKVHPRIVAGVAPLMNLQLHTIKTADHVQRVAKWEKRLTEAEGDLDNNTKVPVLEWGDLPGPQPKLHQIPWPRKPPRLTGWNMA